MAAGARLRNLSSKCFPVSGDVPVHRRSLPSRGPRYILRHQKHGCEESMRGAQTARCQGHVSDDFTFHWFYVVWLYFFFHLLTNLFETKKKNEIYCSTCKSAAQMDTSASCHVIWQHSEDFGGKRKPSLSQETKDCRKRFSQHTAVFTHNHLILKMPPVTFICNRNINCNVPAFLNWPYFLNRFLVLQINYIWPKIPS